MQIRAKLLNHAHFLFYFFVLKLTTKEGVKQLKWKIKIFQKNSLSSKAVTVMLMERFNLTFEVTPSLFWDFLELLKHVLLYK